MEIINDDILTGLNQNIKTVIAHGTNCQHVMSDGIAKYLRSKFPQIYQ